MCRLFGLHGGREPVSATFWLLEAPESLVRQSCRNPDGFGIGTFSDGTPDLDKRPVRASGDELFATQARDEVSRTFVAHVRYASVGELSEENTHPFEQDGRLLGHNGVLSGLDLIDERLGDARDLVRGTTDSERLFALITRGVRDNGGDIRAGIVEATRWLAAEVPVFSLNFVLATPDELWALRYPASNDLLVLERRPGGARARRHLDESSPYGTIRVRSPEATDRPMVVIASEAMDENPDWRMVEPGELVRVGADLRVERELILPDPPAHALALADLSGRAAESQRQERVPAAP